MNRQTYYEDYLIHHGIKGMKWGVRRYQNPDGSLTAAGKNKYYTNGRINDKGKKQREKAKKIKEIGKSRITKGSVIAEGLVAWTRHAWFYKPVRNFIHQAGNMTITQMRDNGESYAKRKRTAAAFVGLYRAVQIAEIAPYAKAAYYKGRYNLDRQYRNRIDAEASMKGYYSQNKKKRIMRNNVYRNCI